MFTFIKITSAKASQARWAKRLYWLYFPMLSVTAWLDAHSLEVPLATLETDERQYALTETIRVTLTNLTDTEIVCPAAPDACALVQFERQHDKSWSRWSTCEWLGEIENPFTIEPGGMLESSLRLDPALRRSGVEMREGTLQPSQGSSRDVTDAEGSQPPAQTEREVEQLIQESPPAPPFFERVRALPHGHYRLVASCAPAGEPEAHHAVRSVPFDVGD